MPLEIQYAKIGGDGRRTLLGGTVLPITTSATPGGSQPITPNPDVTLEIGLRSDVWATVDIAVTPDPTSSAASVLVVGPGMPQVIRGRRGLKVSTIRSVDPVTRGGLLIKGTVTTPSGLPAMASIGDIYIVTTTGDTWNKDDAYAWTGSGWVNIGPLKGERGARGFGFLTGSLPPQPSDGDDGDYWILERVGQSNLLYGPKENGEWPAQPKSALGVGGIADVPGLPDAISARLAASANLVDLVDKDAAREQLQAAKETSPAEPIAPNPAAFATPRRNEERWAKRKAVAGRDFGLPESGDCAPAIVRIMYDLDQRGGGVVQLPPTSLVVGQSLDNRYSRVLVEGGGCGPDHVHNAGSPRYGTVLVPSDVFTVLRHRTPYGGPNTPINSGGGFKDLRVIGNGIAPRLLEIDSITRGHYDLVLEDAVGTEAALFKTGTEGVDFGESPCIQNINCRLQVRQYSPGAAENADCVKFRGSDNANTSIIRDMHLDLVHKNGHAVNLGNSDNIYFDHRSFRISGGTGYSILSAAAASEHIAARANKWLRFSANAPALFQGTDVAAYPSNGHFLPGSIDLENGTPIPTCGPGALAVVDGLSIPFTPVVTASSGTFGGVSAIGSYSFSGAMVTGLVQVSVSSRGTAEGFLLIPAPVRKRPGSIVGYARGREYATVGMGVQGIVGHDNLIAVRFDNDTFPGVTGSVAIVEFSYLV